MRKKNTTSKHTSSQNARHKPRLGIDIGRVIIDGSSHPEGGDTAFFQGDTARMLRTPAMAGAFEIIPRLVEKFGGQVWLVSKCGPRIQGRSRQWLEHHRFFERTGIRSEALHFCLRREDKAPIAERLGLTHFIDDKPDVHSALRGIVEHRYLFGPQRRSVPGLVATRTWQDVEREILGEGGASR